MSDTQLYLAIGVPLLFNGAILALLNNNMNARFAGMEARFASLEARFEILIGKVAELTDRFTRLEERTERK
jgi:hypothetical protein